MKIRVGVTDKEWYECLAGLGSGEADFWQPSGSRSFKVLEPGGYDHPEHVPDPHDPWN